jgi:hypothetical protein
LRLSFLPIAEALVSVLDADFSTMSGVIPGIVTALATFGARGSDRLAMFNLFGGAPADGNAEDCDGNNFVCVFHVV